MAVHHDNFDLYDSSHQPWNSVNMGPKLDIVGAWQKACKKVGVHFAISSHLSNYCHEHMFYQGTNADPEGPYAGIPYDYTNPAYEGLYGKRTSDRIMRLEPEFAQSWYLRTKELIDKYEPELLYFDGPLPNGIYGQQLAAHFYNKNLSRQRSAEWRTHHQKNKERIYARPRMFRRRRFAEKSVFSGYHRQSRLVLHGKLAEHQ